MAVKIRLKRMGKIRQPYYRVVVVDARKKRDGKVIEEIGKYHPKTEPSFIEVTSDRAQYWLGVGAQPSEAVEAILKITGDWQRFKGLPGTEGTLRVAEPKRDKAEIFAEALKDAANEPKSGATTKKAAKKAAAKVEEPEAKTDEPKAEKAEPKAKAEKPEPKAEKPEPTVEEKTEATAETTEEAATASTDESADSTEAEATSDEKSDAETGA